MSHKYLAVNMSASDIEEQFLNPTNMSDPSIPTDRDLTAAVPDELVIHILSFLTRDLGKARCVSWRFHELAKSFFLTEIKFAYRLDTIRRLRTIINNECFNKNISTLYFDTSSYVKDLAMNQAWYANQFQEADSYALDPYVQEVQQDMELMTELGIYLPAAADIMQQHAQAVTDRGNWLGKQDTWSRDTYANYVERYRNERILDNNSVALNVITEAFQKCEKLRHVIFTDYRGLAKKGESYAEACLRMFGRTLPPDKMIENIAMQDILTVTDAVASVPGAVLHSFSIGPNPFVSVKGVMSGVLQHPLTVELLNDRASDPEGYLEESFNSAFANLRTLRLAYYDQVQPNYIGKTPENIWYMLNAAKDTLRNLSITRVGTADDPPDDCSRYPAESDFLSMEFPKLQSLELHHLRLTSEKDLRKFLKRHKSTLRELRLVDCIVSAGTTAPSTDALATKKLEINRAVSLADWGRKNLNLTGIESVQSVDLERLADVPWMMQDEDEWRLISVPPAEIAIRHVERLEKCWIGKRSNTLKRTVDVADRVERQKAGDDWWMAPTSWA